jgi:methylenetetrahydrofolate dehydrogenase (NADP+)/methenyltetrahydrofolate cyclohydrolase
LAAVLVGDNGASETYVASKIKSCEQIGFKSTLVRRDAQATEAEVLEIIDELNKDADVDGFIVQLPLPDHINVDKIIEAIDPKKDVDGFHPINIGRMAKGLPAYVSATPYGVLELLKRYDIPTSGKHCVVVGRSQIVGLPMSILMQRNAYPGNCTVTLTHSRTHNLKEICLQADIIVAALGKPEFVTADMVKPGAVVIDVGLTRVVDKTKKSGYALKGDVKFDEVAEKASFITPVPGGVGLMTVASLMYNTLLASKKEIYG